MIVSRANGGSSKAEAAVGAWYESLNELCNLRNVTARQEQGDVQWWEDSCDFPRSSLGVAGFVENIGLPSEPTLLNITTTGCATFNYRGRRDRSICVAFRIQYE